MSRESKTATYKELIPMPRIKQKTKRTVTHDQWIEITRQNGQTVSTFYPPNAEFERRRLAKDPPPDLIYRRMNFVHGVPSEYEWTQPPPDMRQYGGHCLLRLTTADWLHVMQLERDLGYQHVMRARTQPRPDDFGPCPCARCTAAREDSSHEDE